jgi:hypothetical protein
METQSYATRAVVMSMARHAATALGGYLAGQGIVDAGAVDEIVGALVVLAGVVAGIVEKRQRP